MRWLELVVAPVTAGVLLALLLRGIPWVVRSAMHDVVDETIAPIAARLAEHMDREERHYREMAARIDTLLREWEQHRVVHDQLDERLRRLGG